MIGKSVHRSFPNAKQSKNKGFNSAICLHPLLGNEGGPRQVKVDAWVCDSAEHAAKKPIKTQKKRHRALTLSQEPSGSMIGKNVSRTANIRDYSSLPNHCLLTHFRHRRQTVCGGNRKRSQREGTWRRTGPSCRDGGVGGLGGVRTTPSQMHMLHFCITHVLNAQRTHNFRCCRLNIWCLGSNWQLLILQKPVFVAPKPGIQYLVMVSLFGWTFYQSKNIRKTAVRNGCARPAFTFSSEFTSRF